MRVSSFAPTVCAALALVSRAALAFHIDTDGYAMDGVTSYCDGVTSGGSGVFPNLASNSINRCPILVNLTPTATTVHVNTVLEINWKAQAKFGDITGNIFPRAIMDQAAKKVMDVQSSWIKACKAGTNCATVLDGTPFGDNTDTGTFDGTGLKKLRSYRFTFTETGDFYIFGQVLLPGDTVLNVSGQQFVSFQKITVVDASTSIAPSPSPTPSASSSSGSTATPSPSTTAPTSTTPSATNSTSGIGFNKLTGSSKNGSDEAGTVNSGSVKTSSPTATTSDLPTEGSTTNSSPKESSGLSTGALLGIVAAVCVVVVVIGYAFTMRRKNNNIQSSKTQRTQAQTFRMSRSEHMDDPEPVAYIRKKSVRNSGNHSVPILGGTSASSTDIPMDMSKRGSELQPSFDEMDASFVEGTVTASNKTIATQPPSNQAPPRQPPPPRPASEVAADSTMMMHSSLYADDRDTAVYKNSQSKSPARQSEQERSFYKSEAWDAAATARPYDAREMSTISFNDDARDTSTSHHGFESSSYNSGGMMEQERHTRFNSEASVDSYAFRPSSASVAESYQSRVSRYSLTDSEMDRESSRISGMSLFSDRGTNV